MHAQIYFRRVIDRSNTDYGPCRDALTAAVASTPEWRQPVGDSDGTRHEWPGV